MTKYSERIEITHRPVGERLERQFRCPECEHRLPIDSVTECDNCGAHIELHVHVIAPAINHNA